MNAAAPRSTASASTPPAGSATRTPITSSSNDYYTSRNYASRLIGNRLVFYTPLSLEWDDDPLEALPGMRKWRPRL